MCSMNGELDGSGQFKEPEQPTHGSPLRSKGREGCLVPSNTQSAPRVPLGPAPETELGREGIANKLGDAIRI